MKRMHQEIRAVLDSVAIRLSSTSSRPVWTREIKEGLLDLGHKHGYFVCANRVSNEADWGEWLYDLCWLKQMKNPTASIPIAMPLALESEWNKDQGSVIEDFQKLLVSKATTKLFVYQDNRTLLEYFKTAISKWDDAKGTYLFARYDNESCRFEYSVV